MSTRPDALCPTSVSIPLRKFRKPAPLAWGAGRFAVSIPLRKFRKEVIVTTSNAINMFPSL